MAKSVTYNKRENEKKKQARRAEKQKKKEDCLAKRIVLMI